MKRIYMDHAATTPVSEPVLEAMLPYWGRAFGNASSIHSYGREARKGMDEARGKVAAALGAQRQEIVFTSGGTEADNLAIKGVIEACGKRHIITTSIEHPAVLNTCAYMERQGCRVTYLPVNGMGFVSAGQVKEALCDDTALVSVMAANNEIGTIQPVAEIGAVCAEAGVPFHTDAVQAIGAVEIDVQAMHIDLLSLSAHKFYGPKGAGALYVRKGITFAPQIQGGEQERKKRAGTENIPAIVGLGAAIEQAVSGIAARCARLERLRDRLIDGVLCSMEQVELNGDRHNRLCNNANLFFRHINGETLVMLLDMEGIAASSASACTAGSAMASHVLAAIGRSKTDAHGALRLTLGEETTEQDVDTVVEKLAVIVPRLRA